MIHYFKFIIKYFVDLIIENLENLKSQFQSLSVKKSETDNVFEHELNYNSNAVAFKQQMHSKNHTYICFKYIKKKFQKCKFFFFHKLIAETYMNIHKVIQLK